MWCQMTLDRKGRDVITGFRATTVPQNRGPLPSQTGDPNGNHVISVTRSWIARSCLVLPNTGHGRTD